jgi:stalled ribosome rescue protein Dom34
MKHYHAAIWIDHTQARVFSLNADDSNEWTVRPHDHHVHLHHKAGKGDAGKAPLDAHYFHSVADAVKDAGEIVIFGPGTAKTELMHHMQKHDPKVAAKVVGVETVDHPTDGELMNVAKKFFRKADHMRPQTTAAPR